MQYLQALWKMLTRFFSPMFFHIKNATPVLFTIIMILTFVGIWTYGESWSFAGLSNKQGFDYAFAQGFGFNYRILTTTIVVLFLAIILILGLQYKNRKLSKQNNDLSQEKERENMVLPYIKDQEESLTLMKTALKDNLLDKNYIYQLPWYMVIGAEDAGKTSFINRSNQKFTLTAVERTSKKYLRKDTLYQVDWWASNDAILIDPAGEMLTQLSSKEDANGEIAKGLWEHLLNWISSARSRRPLNGIVLVLDLPKLIGFNHSDRQGLAALFRTRIRDMTEKFGARIPVYVVLNKFDLIEGFEDFYDDLKQSERYENLGFSFTLNSNDHIDDWTQEFSDSYDKYVLELEEIIFDKLAMSLSQESREAMYMYTRQLSGMKNILTQFISDVLESDRFSTTPYVRGVYFSSNFQQGLPIDFYQTALSKQFDLPYIVPTYVAEKSQRTYFTHDFFNNIIYPEAGLVSENKREQRKRKHYLAFSLFILGLTSATLLAGWQNYYHKNKIASKNVMHITEQLSGMKISQITDPTGRNLLKPLNLLKQATNAFGDYKHATPIFADLGLYQGRKIGEKMNEAYQYFLAHRYLPDIAIGLIEQMKATDDHVKGLALLRVYRMIDDKENRTVEIPRQWMSQYLQEMYPNDGSIQQQLMSHFDYAMQHVDPDLKMFDKTIAQKQHEYRKELVPERVYASFKVQGNTALSPAIDLKQEIGLAYYKVFQDMDVVDEVNDFKDTDTSRIGTLISPLFTDWAYKSFYARKSDDLLHASKIDTWVLGKHDDLSYSEQELELLSKDIRELYIQDYITTWQDALNGLTINEFTDLEQAHKILDALTGPNEPLQHMINVVDKNSEIYPILSDVEIDNKKNGLVLNANQKAALQISRHFSGLTNLVKANGETPAYMNQIINKLNELKFYLQDIQDSPELGQSALKSVIAELKLEKTNPATELKRIANNVAEPLSSQLKSIATNAWNIEFYTALIELDRMWKEDIYDFYRKRMARKYPINSRAISSISLTDFQNFFGPKGKVQNFYDNYLKFFIEENKELMIVNGHNVISEAFTQGIAQVLDVQDTFFDASGKMNIDFSIKPLGLSGKFRSSMLNIDGQIIKYAHGRSYASRLIWPNTTRDDVETKLTFVGRSGHTYTIRKTGAWSLFRFIQLARTKKVSDQTVDLSFRNHSGTMNYRLLAEDENNPFIHNVLGAFKLPSHVLTDKVNFNKE